MQTGSDEWVQFLGAAGTVTGARFLVECHGRRVLVDCGQFQGLKPLRLRNWQPFPVEPSYLDAVILTHAHLDHSGWLPRLVRQGFSGPIYASPATIDLARLLLTDAAHLEEENAEYANRHGSSRHQPALPLFTERDVERTVRLFRPLGHGEPRYVPDSGFCFTFSGSGHILGSAIVDLRTPAGRRVVFSGDLGRYDYPILRDPQPLDGDPIDLLVLESTYGDQQHENLERSRARLAAVVRRSVARGGILLAPAFAVGRTQTLLYFLRQLEDAEAIPSLPVIVDSPMAVAVSRYYQSHAEEHDPETLARSRCGGRAALYPRQLRFASTVQESKALNELRGGAILISASGMLTGGRILHHALQRLPDPASTLLLVGYQAEGTRGRTLADGGGELKIFGQTVPVRAEVAQIDGLSAHADGDELLRWLGTRPAPPRSTCLVHGEPGTALVLADRIRRQLRWPVQIPAHGERVTLE